MCSLHSFQCDQSILNLELLTTAIIWGSLYKSYSSLFPLLCHSPFSNLGPCILR
ncbi:hypothetical protein C0J52_13232 [Blattella germanica]|nr:hypothetical protein C0J52_13232 [Blattella germanica]